MAPERKKGINIMRLMILTSILTPYRVYFFDRLQKHLRGSGGDLKVIVMAASEPHRVWKYEEYKRSYTRLLKGISINAGQSNLAHLNIGLVREIRGYRPDIIVAAGSWTLSTVWEAIVLRHILNYKLIFWSESHLQENKNYGPVKVKFRNFLRTLVMSRFDGFWVPGAMARALVDKHGRAETAKFMVPNIVDEKFYRSAGMLRKVKKSELLEKYGIPSGRYIMLITARLAPEKGLIPFFEKALLSLNASKLVILVAGKGPMESAIKEWVDSQYKLDIRLIGNKSREEMLELYALCDVFTLPSLSDPNPLSVIEALWAGLPVLVSAHVGNYPEAVEQGINGYVFSYDKGDEITGYIDSLVISTDKWRLNAESRSREIAARSFGIEHVLFDVLPEMSLWSCRPAGQTGGGLTEERKSL